MFRLIAPLAVGLALLTPPAAGQNKPTTDPDIVIKGTTDRQVDTLLRQLAPTKNDRQIARWDNRVCPAVLGLSPERAAYITGRIAAAATSIGAAATPGGTCRPNVLIVFTPLADAFAADVVDKHPGYIQDIDRAGLPRGKVKAGYLTPRPVRWFTINRTVMADGGTADLFPWGAPDGRRITFTPPSRIAASTRETTLRTLIVVDEPKLAGLKWSQLGDYLAMVSLSQPRMDADYAGADSVMAVFADRDAGKAGPLALTDQDRRFLTALYASDPALSAERQRDQIASRFKRR